MAALDPDAAKFLADLRAADAPPLTAGTPDDARLANAAFLSEVGLVGPEVDIVAELEVPTSAGSVAARRYRMSGEHEAVLVYLHGGGWVVGDLDTLDGVCRLLAVDGGFEVFSIDYRLAPEHPFPAGLDDVCDALHWVAETHANGRPLLIAGDSSGGNLAAAAALRLRDEAGPQLALQVLLYPVLDCDFSTGSYQQFAEGYLLQRADMEWFWDQYIARPDDRVVPYASPLRAETLAGLPPTYIAVGGYDPLRDEGLTYATRLRSEGIRVECDNYESMLHGFVSIPQVVPFGAVAAAEIVAKVRALFADLNT